MGKFLKASCKCGYTKSSLNFGHGMYNNENFGVPCLVLDSFEVCSSDITKINENIDVLFYNNSLLLGMEPKAIKKIANIKKDVVLDKYMKVTKAFTDEQMDKAWG